MRTVTNAVLFGAFVVAAARLHAEVPCGTASWPDILKHSYELNGPAAIRTARIEWACRDRRSKRGSVMFRSTEYALDQVLGRSHGDQHGNLAYNEDGSPSEQRIGASTLFSDGETWISGPVPDLAWMGAGKLREWDTLDFRDVVYAPVGIYSSFDEYCANVADLTFDYTVREMENEVVVEGRYHRPSTDDQGVFRWHLDPQHNYRIVRTESGDPGDRPHIVTEVKWRDATGGAFPSEIKMSGSDGPPLVEFDIYAAEVNQPDHRQRFTPSDIGLEPGTTIMGHGLHSTGGARVWDGEALVSPTKWAQAVAERRAAFGPAILEELAHRKALFLSRAAEIDADRAKAASRPVLESLWERYTRAFIAHFNLDSSQAERAWAILRDCQESGALALRRAADRAHSAAPGSRAALAAEDRIRAIETDIFEKRLKPRLNTLPTKAQRTASGDFEFAMPQMHAPIPAPTSQGTTPAP